MRNVSRDALIYNNSSCNKIVLNDEFVYTKHSFTHMQRDEGGLNIIINTVIDRGEWCDAIATVCAGACGTSYCRTSQDDMASTVAIICGWYILTRRPGVCLSYIRWVLTYVSKHCGWQYW